MTVKAINFLESEVSAHVWDGEIMRATEASEETLRRMLQEFGDEVLSTVV